ncbi:hypothetical protein [Streptomyces niveus]|uniref:hypothetical protein n=1 Tax=Streptomyces niveus TaxID=193462 RepID=UPI0036D100EB
MVLAVRADDAGSPPPCGTPAPNRSESTAGSPPRPDDQCFRALSDVVALAQRHPAITAITVIRRNGQALARHEAGAAGAASWALEAERARPYTEQEATAFLSLHRRYGGRCPVGAPLHQR